jgi:hypothetical protein
MLFQSWHIFQEPERPSEVLNCPIPGIRRQIDLLFGPLRYNLAVNNLAVRERQNPTHFFHCDIDELWCQGCVNVFKPAKIAKCSACLVGGDFKVRVQNDNLEQLRRHFGVLMRKHLAYFWVSRHVAQNFANHLPVEFFFLQWVLFEHINRNVDVGNVRISSIV